MAWEGGRPQLSISFASSDKHVSASVCTVGLRVFVCVGEGWGVTVYAGE